MTRNRDKTTCTITYQGKSADLDDKEAAEDLLTPMFQKIYEGGKQTLAMKYRQLYLSPELEPKAIELAQLVAQLHEVEEDKKASMAAFKEAIDLLKLQIKALANAINEGMGVRMEKQRPMQPAGYRPVFDDEGSPPNGDNSMLGATLGDPDPEKTSLRAVGGKKAEHPELG